MSKIIASLFLTICFSTQPQLGAQGNLVANGGFESLFAGWEGTWGYLDHADFAYEGTVVGVVIDIGSSSVNQTMHQLLSTEPAVPYVLRFSLLSGAGRAGEQSPPGASPVLVKWGNQTIGQFANASTTSWKSYQFNVTANSLQTELNFASIGTRYQLIDDISVTAVPEPTTTALLIGGAGLVYTFQRRNRVRPA
jgi:hypothetical protein